MKRTVFAIALCFYAAAIFLCVFCFVSYNSLVGMKHDVQKQQAQIENVLQARLEKIPDLVQAVQSYAKHEEKVFTAVTEARSGLQEAIASGDMESMANANEKLDTALVNLNAVVESYPELQSSQHYTALMDEISGSVNRIAQERRLYNEAAANYNKKLEMIPTVIVAKLFDFKPIPLFTASDEAHTNNIVIIE